MESSKWVSKSAFPVRATRQLSYAWDLRCNLYTIFPESPERRGASARKTEKWEPLKQEQVPLICGF
jgi:hypothetical protein